MSCAREQRVNRPAQYRSSARNNEAARQKSMTHAGSAAIPSLRRARANETRRVISSGTEQLGLCASQVVDVLDGPTECLARGFAVDRIGAENGERSRPVDRLRDAGWLRQLHGTQPRHG